MNISISTYLKLELLSLLTGSFASAMARFHLFEAGAFVTPEGSQGQHQSAERFHLFEAGAFVTPACVALAKGVVAFPPI